MAALKKKQTPNSSTDETATHPSTASGSTTQATPSKPVVPPTTPTAPPPTTIPPTPASNTMDKIIALLQKNEKGIADIKIACSKQDAQIKQMKMELGVLKSTIENFSVPPVLNLRNLIYY